MLCTQGFGLDLALLYVDLVTAENDGDVLADAGEVTWRLLAWGPMLWVIGRRTMPVGDVLVGNTRGDIEHDDTALAVDVVSITETTELLLAGGIPHVELNLAEVLCICVRVELSFWWFVSFEKKYMATLGVEVHRLGFTTVSLATPR